MGIDRQVDMYFLFYRHRTPTTEEMMKEVKAGDKIMEDNLGKYITVIEMHEGQRIIRGSTSLKDADEAARVALKDPAVRRTYTATRTI